MELHEVECPECHKTVEISYHSVAWCSRWPDGTPHKTREMK